jgi:hypothetical protein
LGGKKQGEEEGFGGTKTRKKTRVGGQKPGKEIFPNLSEGGGKKETGFWNKET